MKRPDTVNGFPPVVRCVLCRHEFHYDSYQVCPECRGVKTFPWISMQAPLNTPEMERLWLEMRDGAFSTELWPFVRDLLVKTCEQRHYIRPSVYAARLLGLAYFLSRGVPGPRAAPLVVSQHTGRMARARAARKRKRVADREVRTGQADRGQDAQ